MDISYRLFDLNKEDINRLFVLFRNTYGESSNYENRFNWEYFNNPNEEKIKILIAVCNNQIVGATSRSPFCLVINGSRIETAFSVNSMVHSNYRRMGIMENLYKESFKIFPLLFSKGTMPGMYKLLMKLGYEPLFPNTVLTTVLSPLKWMVWRAGIYKPSPVIKTSISIAQSSFKAIDQFAEEFNAFWNRVQSSYQGIIAKNHVYMNWRYFQIPHKKYKAFYRFDEGKIVSAVVLGYKGSTGKIVDILWDHQQKDEPDATISYAKRYFKKCGFIKASCWCTYGPLRSSLKKQSFADRGESPNFSYFSNDKKLLVDSDVSKFHFVEGDGDSEYL